MATHHTTRVRKRISQREAKRLRAQVAKLSRLINQQRARWSSAYLGGMEISRATWKDDMTIPAVIRTARMLGHAVVVLGDETGLIRFIALPHPAEVIV